VQKSSYIRTTLHKCSDTNKYKCTTSKSCDSAVMKLIKRKQFYTNGVNFLYLFVIVAFLTVYVGAIKANDACFKYVTL